VTDEQLPGQKGTIAMIAPFLLFFFILDGSRRTWFLSAHLQDPTFRCCSGGFQSHMSMRGGTDNSISPALNKNMGRALTALSQLMFSSSSTRHGLLGGFNGIDGQTIRNIQLNLKPNRTRQALISL
jgi:hypothetical protein